MYTTPSVFSSTGWVDRYLSCVEVLHCLDIPQQFDSPILEHFGSDMSANEWSFLVKAPTRKGLNLFSEITFVF